MELPPPDMTMPDSQSPLSSTGAASVRMHLLKPLLSGVLSAQLSADTLPPFPEPVDPLSPLKLLTTRTMDSVPTTAITTAEMITHISVFDFLAGGSCCCCGMYSA